MVDSNAIIDSLLIHTQKSESYLNNFKVCMCNSEPVKQEPSAVDTYSEDKCNFDSNNMLAND